MVFVDENATQSSLNVQAEPVAKLEKPLAMQRGIEQQSEAPAVAPSAKYRQLSATYAHATAAFTKKSWSAAKSSVMKGVSHSAASRVKVAAWWRAKAPLRKVRRAVKSGHEKLQAGLNQQKIQQMLLAVKAGKEKLRAGLNQQKFQELLLASQQRFTMSSAKQQAKYFVRACQQKLLSRLQSAPAEAPNATATVHSVEVFSAQPLEQVELPGDVEELQESPPTEAVAISMEMSSAQPTELAEALPEDAGEIEQQAPTATAAVEAISPRLGSASPLTQPSEPAEQLPEDSEEIEQMANLSDSAVEEESIGAQNEQNEEEEEAADAIADEEDPMEVVADIAEEEDLPVGGEADAADWMMPQDPEVSAHSSEEAEADWSSAPDAWLPVTDPVSGYIYYWNQYTHETSW